jgi:pimeloyl-ACP methyl ester carboxylesterase
MTGQTRSPAATLERPAWLPEAVWPFELRTIRVEGLTLHYTDEGTGPPLLFLNPPFPSLLWRDVLEDLRHEFRCLAVDLPGTGLSQRIPARLQTLADEARSLAGFLDALGMEEVTPVFHDLGGLIGVTALAGRPERVRALVAVNTLAWPPGPLPERAMLRLMGSAPMRELDAVIGFLPRLVAGRFGGGRHHDRATRHAVRQSMRRPADRRLVHRLMRELRENLDLARQAETVLRGPLANRPLLTIFGQFNDYFGLQPVWRELFPHARQVVVPHGNHFPMGDAPNLVAASIQAFWHDQVEGARG